MSEFLISLVLFAIWLVDIDEVKGSLYSPLLPSQAWIKGLVIGATVLTSVCALVISPLIYVQLTNLCMKTTTRERYIVTPNQRRASTRSHRGTNESEQLIQAERELMMPLIIDSSALTDGIVFLVTTRVCCCDSNKQLT